MPEELPSPEAQPEKRVKVTFTISEEDFNQIEFMADARGVHPARVMGEAHSFNWFMASLHARGYTELVAHSPDPENEDITVPFPDRWNIVEREIDMTELLPPEEPHENNAN